MKKISLFFAIFFIAQVFYASENSLKEQHDRAKGKYSEIIKKLHDFQEEFFQKRFNLPEKDQEKLECVETQMGTIQRSIFLADSLVDFNQELDDELLQAIKGCVIMHEQRVKK